MLLEHIIPEIQSEKNSMIYGQEITEEELEKLKKEEEENESENIDDYSLNSEDMENAHNALTTLNEKRVKFT